MRQGGTRVYGTYPSEQEAQDAAQHLYDGGRKPWVERVLNLPNIGIEPPRTTDPWVVLVDAE